MWFSSNHLVKCKFLDDFLRYLLNILSVKAFYLLEMRLVQAKKIFFWTKIFYLVEIDYIYIYLLFVNMLTYYLCISFVLRLYTINLCLWIAKKSNGILHDAIRVWYIHIFTVHKSRCGMPVVYVVVSLCLCVRAWLHTCNVLATYLRDVHLYMQAGQQDQQEISTISGIIVDGIVLVNGSSESPSNSI